jgi:hypothetical protein
MVFFSGMVYPLEIKIKENSGLASLLFGRLWALNLVLVLLSCVLVLPASFFIHGWDAEAAFGGQVTEVANNVPHLLVFEEAFPAGHSRIADAVLNDPLQLTIAVILNPLRGKIGHRRRHLVGKWYARVLPVEAVADLTMMLKVLGPALDGFLVIGSGVGPILAADSDFLGFLGNCFFNGAGLPSLTAK